MTLFPDRSIDAPSPHDVVTERSAGRAWLLSLLAPGAGQLYCGATTRGVATLILFFGSVLIVLFVRSSLLWLGVRTGIMLYAFAGLDAYLTALEQRIGIEADAADNPRVAAILNLTTNGFGYVYLGWKVGFGTFLGLFFFWRSIGATLPALGEAVAFALAIHAYIGGIRARREIYTKTLDSLPETSRIPPAIPWALTAAILGGYFVLVLIGQVVLLTRGGR